MHIIGEDLIIPIRQFIKVHPYRSFAGSCRDHALITGVAGPQLADVAGAEGVQSDQPRIVHHRIGLSGIDRPSANRRAACLSERYWKSGPAEDLGDASRWVGKLFEAG